MGVSTGLRPIGASASAGGWPITSTPGMTPLVCDQGVVFADLKFTVFKRVAQVAGRSEFTFANRDDDRREIQLALVLVPVLA